MARHCVGAWFFGRGTDFLPDRGPFLTHGNAQNVTGNIFQVVSPYGPAFHAQVGSNFRITLGSISGAHPLAFSDASAMMLGCRLNYEIASDTYGRVLDKSTAGSGANGWSFTIQKFSGLVDLLFYIGGSLAMRSNTVPTAEVSGRWAHIVITARFGYAASAAGNGFYVNGVFYPPVGTTVGTPPAATANMAFYNWNHTGARRLVGELEHVTLFAKKSPGDYFTDGEIMMALEDPYAPFRSEVPLAFFGVPGVVPPSEFEPHRMFLAGD